MVIASYLDPTHIRTYCYPRYKTMLVQEAPSAGISITTIMHIKRTSIKAVTDRTNDMSLIMESRPCHGSGKYSQQAQPHANARWLNLNRYSNCGRSVVRSSADISVPFQRWCSEPDEDAHRRAARTWLRRRSCPSSMRSQRKSADGPCESTAVGSSSMSMLGKASLSKDAR